jgi:acyl-coenzyme A synthetase/AMP-(fatty) acid ligase
MPQPLPPKPRFQRLLHDSLLLAAHTCPTKAALITEREVVTYAELFDKVRRCAAALVRAGLRRGDRVIIFADNTSECVVSIWATLWVGGIFVTVNPQTKTDKLKYVIQKSGARILVTDEHLWPQFEPLLSEPGILDHVFCGGAAKRTPLETAEVEVEDYWQALESQSALESPAFTIPLDVAALIFTSGSTGTPKGVTMTHQSMVFARDSITEYLRLSDEDRIINVLPLAFDYGLYQLLMAVGLGATLVLARSFAYPGRVMDQIKEHQVTVFPGVPTIYSHLLSMHQKTPLCFPSVRRVTNTAAALPPDYIPSLRKVFPNALIFAMYGLTECKRVSYLEPELIETKRGSVGKPIPGTEMFLLSADGKRVGPGERGILHVRGPHVMLGYWNDPERTAKMIKPGDLPGERVLCAQDWFTMDEDGYFYFQGRSDDIIKSGGEKISPVEVENVLFGLKGVKEAAVVGIPDETLGQAVKAFVVLEPGFTISAKEILRHCSTRLENFMMPRALEFLPELPKTDNGKIKKDALR